MIEKQIKRHRLNTSIHIRVGDRLKCVPGFSNVWCTSYVYTHLDPNYGGAGYSPGKIFISHREFILSNDDEVFFPNNSSYGVFHKALRKI